MADSKADPPRRRRWRWPARLLGLLLLGAATLLALDAAGRLPPQLQRACERAGLCGHDLLPGAHRATRLEFTVTAPPQAPQATRAAVLAQRQGEEWLLRLRIDALPGAQRYSLIQVFATRETTPPGQPALLTLHDENRDPLLNGRWEVTVAVPNTVFREREWVLRYRADTIDALAVSEDIAPFIRQSGAIR